MAGRLKTDAEMPTQALDVVAPRLGGSQKRAIGQDQRACEIIGETDPGKGARLVAQEARILREPVQHVAHLQEGELRRLYRRLHRDSRELPLASGVELPT